MPTVWFVNHHASAPGESGAGQRHYELGRALRDQGWEAVVIAASTEHGTGRQRVAGRRLMRDDFFDGVVIRWLRVPRYASGMRRVVNMVAFWMRLVLPSATRGLPAPDVIVGSTVHPLAALGAKTLARRARTPFVFEIRDLWPETLIDMGAIGRGSVPAKALVALEKHLCDNAQLVVTTMPFASEYLVDRGVPAEKVLWISNGIRLRDFEPTPLPDGTRPLTFTYFGSLGRANAVDTIVQGFADADLPTARLRLVGSGPARSQLQDLAASLGVAHQVDFSEPVPRSEVPALATDAHCLVVAVRDIPLYRFGVSLNKLFEYMALARPVLFIGTVRGNPVDLANGGLCVTESAAAAGFRAIGDASARQRDEWARANREYAERHFDFNELAHRLDAALRQVGR